MEDDSKRPETLPEYLKNLPHELKEDIKQIPYHLEQQPPNKPSFLTVVLLAGAVIIVLFIVAWFFLHWEGGKVLKHPYRKNPTSQLVLPQHSTFTTLGTGCPT